MKNPYLQLLAFCLFIVAVTLSAIKYGHIELPVISWFALLFFFLLNAAIHAIIAPSLQSKSNQFVSLFMATQGIRMFFSLGFLILYLLFVVNREISFVVYFLLLYLSFTGFEIYLLLSNLRADLKKGSIQE